MSIDDWAPDHPHRLPPEQRPGRQPDPPRLVGVPPEHRWLLRHLSDTGKPVVSQHDDALYLRVINGLLAAHDAGVDIAAMRGTARNVQRGFRRVAA